MVVRTYFEVHDEPEPSNTVTNRTYEAIALWMTGGLNGALKIFFLNTGHTLERSKCNGYPIPQWVINTVNKGGVNNKKI